MSLVRVKSKSSSRGLGFFISLLLLCSGCFEGGKSTQPRQKIVAGISADFRPFEFRIGSEIVGYDVDVVRAIAKELGYAVEFKDMDFSAIIPSLQSGIIDFGVGVTLTEERKKSVDFSEIYFRSSYALITKKESTLDLSLPVSGKIFGVQLGTTLEKFAKERLKSSWTHTKLHTLAKFPTLVEELKVGRIDGIVSEDIQSIEFVKANPEFKKQSLGESEDGYAIAFRKGDDLKASVSAAILKLKNKELNEIHSKWIR